MTGVKRPYRLRSIHRAMSFDTFERTVPVRPGWKREYYDGTAHVRPSWAMVTFMLRLGQHPGDGTEGIRPVRQSDVSRLYEVFLDAFRYAPEYCDCPMPAYRRRAKQYIDGFFGDVRGRWSQSSVLLERDETVTAAALVKERDGREPLLDCLFVRPAYFRTGLATAVTTAAATRLCEAGHRELTSTAMLANEASLAWHQRFGFRELPDVWVAQARCFSAKHEIERLESIGALTPPERERLETIAERWWDEIRRLDRLPRESRHPAEDA